MASGKHSVPKGAKRHDWKADREKPRKRTRSEGDSFSREEEQTGKRAATEVTSSARPQVRPDEEPAEHTAPQPRIEADPAESTAPQPRVETSSSETTAPHPVVAPSIRPREEVVARSHQRPGSGKRKAIIALVVIVVVIAAVVGVYFGFLKEKPATVNDGQVVTVEVPSGASTADIAQLLKNQGVISLSGDFTQRVKELGDDGKLQSGTYRFTGGESLDTIISDLASGNTGYTLTIPEGFTLEQIAARVHKVCGISKSEFYKLAHTGSKQFVSSYPFLANCYKGSMEGFLFPDTYRVAYGASAKEIIGQMLANFQAKISQVDMTYARSKNLDEYDVCTLASIIEKESRTSDDKQGIACVFYNRLHANMALGSDVTTYYAVGKKLTETLTTKDLASSNPYNTRNEKNKGLPPGAICSPGLEALQAAANPSQDSYLYFFWSKSQNKTIFCTTAAEFESKWKKYGD